MRSNFQKQDGNLQRATQYEAHFVNRWPSQAVVGAVCFERVDPPGTAGLGENAWYAGAPHAAWRVGAAVAFTEPIITGIRGYQVLCGFKTLKAQQQRVREALHARSTDAAA